MPATNTLLGGGQVPRAGTRTGSATAQRRADVQNKDIDGTPLCLGGLVIGAVLVLAFFKVTGFRMVVGIGGS